uniref:Uncharacterized protein n=1 Tax=viral metagenome TaxID=1070528 RepID=A0A6C0JPS5_9ZZZZ
MIRRFKFWDVEFEGTIRDTGPEYYKFYENKTMFDTGTLLILKTGYDNRFYCAQFTDKNGTLYINARKTDKNVMDMYTKIINSKKCPLRFAENEYRQFEDYKKLVDENFKKEIKKNSEKIMSSNDLVKDVNDIIVENDFYPIGFKKRKKILSFNKLVTVKDLRNILKDINLHEPDGMILASNVPFGFKNIKKIIENLKDAHFCSIFVDDTDYLLYDKNLEKIKGFDTVLTLEMSCTSG